MGKEPEQYKRRNQNCSDDSSPICDSDCCTVPPDASKATVSISNDSSSESILNHQHKERPDEDEIKELLVIGAGPHGLSLLLRLLEPDADLQTDKERHSRAEFKQKMRPFCDVHAHVKKLRRGPSVILKPKKKKKNSPIDHDPPPLSLEDVRNSTMVVDSHGGWLSGWKQNFDAVGITRLRSPMNAHADPYDHRSLEYYAEAKGREDELVKLTYLSQRDKDYKGPYHAPSTALFNDFHDVLANAYGISDIVQRGTIQSICPIRENEESDEPIFEVKIQSGVKSDHPPEFVTAKTRRVVLAMGPVLQSAEAFWETSLRKELSSQQRAYPSNRILHANEIFPFIAAKKKVQKVKEEPIRRLLIVGGGLTSAQLALLAAKSPWCQAVTFVLRGQATARQFDLDNRWMGPNRGKMLDKFWSLPIPSRAQLLKDARRGGSITPEHIHELRSFEKKQNLLFQIHEEAQISSVHWINEQFHVMLDDGTDSQQCDMIWLSTGLEPHIDMYSALTQLQKELPVQVVNGLPVLNKDLSWRAPLGEDTTNEPKWKQKARERFWCMGSLAALELGPDALNLIGARHGAVRVAKAIRQEMALGK